MILWYEFRVQGWDRTDAVRWLEKHPAGWINVYDGEDNIYTVMLGRLLRGGD